MAFFKQLSVEQFRGIKHLSINNLRTVNLIVGDNNCGKTSVLEAIELLRSSGSLANVYRVARQRDSLAVHNSNSIFDNFICMFPRENDGMKEIIVSGICNGQDVSFTLKGKQDRILLDTKELNSGRNANKDLPQGEIETEAFTGSIQLKYGSQKKEKTVEINQFSTVTGTSSSDKDAFNIIYVAPFEHLSGNIISGILRDESYKNICLKALQLFDPDIEDLMIFRSDIGNRPVEYIRHKKLGDMPVSTYGDGIKKVLALASAVARAAGGILLIDEIETAIHKKYYDDVFRFIVKACIMFNVQLFVTTHSIEVIDGLLLTQDYDQQQTEDEICVCTVKKTAEGAFSRILTGREVYENREAFGFEVRL